MAHGPCVSLRSPKIGQAATETVVDVSGVFIIGVFRSLLHCHKEHCSESWCQDTTLLHSVDNRTDSL